MSARPEPVPDPDMEAVIPALIRAGQRAREVARQTGTAIVVVRDGKIVEEKQAPGETGSIVGQLGLTSEPDNIRPAG